MYQILTIVHLVIAIATIGLILMQQGKGADAGAAFGNGGSSSVFGARGASNFLSRTTAILATCFFVTSLILAVLAGGQTASLSDDFITNDTGVAVPSTPPKAPETDLPELD